MADAPPQIYLLLPPVIEPDFPARLGRVLDRVLIACLRLDLAARDAGAIGRASDLVREIAHLRDVPVVIAEHVEIAKAHGLDGIHLPDGPRSVRAARTALGADRIVGAFCRDSRHDGLLAGEAGADYVAFGPVRADRLGDGREAPRDLFEWWSEMIEVPCVAEGIETPDIAARFGSAADFIAISPAIWDEPDPAESLAAIQSALA